MLLTTILALLAAAPQDPPPTTSALMDMPLVVMATTPASAVASVSDLMLSEAGQSPVLLSLSDPRMNIADIVALPTNLIINSFSRGTGALYSKMSATGAPYPDVPECGWSYLMVSVSGGSWAQDSAYHAEASAPGGNIAGDVFAYILDGSEDWFPDGHVGAVHKVREGDNVDIDIPLLADIDGFLSGYAVTDEYVEEADAELGDGTLRFYFTLRSIGTNSDYLNIPQSWGPSGTKWKRPSTIFEVKHIGGSWSLPQVYKTGGKMGLSEWSEICALSVMDPEFAGAPSASGINILLSTRDPYLTHKLWVTGQWVHPTTLAMTSYNGPLRTAGGGLFAEDKLRITNPTQQYVEATCGDDPGDDAGSSTHHRLRRERTALIVNNSTGNQKLDFSLHQLRNFGPRGSDSRFRATLQGFATINDRYAVLMLEEAGVSTPLLYVTRNPGSPSGDKQYRNFDLPWLSGVGTPVTMYWNVHGSAGQILDRSQKFRILVR